MREDELRERAFAMPLTYPAYPPGPYRFVDREYLKITYRTDPAKLRAVVPEPLGLNEHEPLVRYEFIRMPDSTGFGDYTETGQVIPVSTIICDGRPSSRFAGWRRIMRSEYNVASPCHAAEDNN
jgi:acetoacetate decarboxylase